MYVTIIFKNAFLRLDQVHLIALQRILQIAYDNNSAIYVILRFLLGYDETVVWIPCEKIEDL